MSDTSHVLMKRWENKLINVQQHLEATAIGLANRSLAISIVLTRVASYPQAELAQMNLQCEQ